MRQITFLALAGLLLAAVPAAAQTDPNMPRYDSFRVGIYRMLNGLPATDPVSPPTVIPRTGLACGQPVTPPPAPGAVVANPTRFTVADPDTVAPNLRDCLWTDPGTGPLFALPFDPVFTYIAKGSWHNVNGYGDQTDSANSFQRPGSRPDAARTFVLR